MTTPFVSKTQATIPPLRHQQNPKRKGDQKHPHSSTDNAKKRYRNNKPESSRWLVPPPSPVPSRAASPPRACSLAASSSTCLRSLNLRIAPQLADSGAVVEVWASDSLRIRCGSQLVPPLLPPRSVGRQPADAFTYSFRLPRWHEALDRPYVSIDPTWTGQNCHPQVRVCVKRMRGS